MNLIHKAVLSISGFCLYMNSGLFALISQEEQKLIDHVILSIENAERGVSKLSEETLKIDGMSSSKVRHFMNNLCSLPNTTYLEIGCWKGSTWVASLYGNTASVSYAYAIDNWSQFGNQEAVFMSNCKHFLALKNYSVYSVNSFALPIEWIKTPITTYFYDGDHNVLSQELAFTYYDQILCPTFIAVIDDWNYHEVKEGTASAFKKLGYEILFKRELSARFNGDLQEWWNGLFVAVVRKKANIN